MRILAINPGSTSTKIAVYEDTTPLLVRNIRHSVGELSHFPRVIDQFEFRKNLVIEALKENGIPFEFDAIVGRGGLLKPIPGGVYEVNDAMLVDFLLREEIVLKNVHYFIVGRAPDNQRRAR